MAGQLTVEEVMDEFDEAVSVVRGSHTALDLEAIVPFLRAQLKEECEQAARMKEMMGEDGR